MSQRFSVADVASHKTANDLYIIVDEDVYDLTNFQEEHPGGKKSVFAMNSYHTLHANKLQSSSA
jgi:cytochrome b involved in lipid metabolism